MATINAAPVFVGRSASNLIKKAMVTNTSLAKNLFTIKENVKGSYTIRTVDYTGAIQGKQCGWAPENVDADFKNVTLDIVNVQVEECKDDLNFDWLSYDMQPGANGSFTEEGASVIAEDILSKIAVNLDKKIWTDIAAEAVAETAPDVTLAMPLTVDNILDEVGKVYQLLYQIENFDISKAVIVMHTSHKAMYEQALAKKGAMPAFYLDEKGTNYLGVRIEGIVGANPNYVIGTFTDNLYYLTDSDNERNSIKIVDMNIVNENNIRFAAHFYHAATYAFRDQMIVGHITT